MRSLVALACAAAVSVPLCAQRPPFDVSTMMKLARISEPVLSPDGRLVAFTSQTVDLDKNIKPKQIYVVPVDGGFARQVTHDGTDNERPRWSPDSRLIYYVSNRDGSAQIWSMAPDGSNARQISHLSTEAAGILVSPDGKKIVLLSNVYPSCGADYVCNKSKIASEAASKVKARIYTSLLFRHWTEWQSNRRQHILVMNADGTGVKDLTPGDRDAPPFSLGGPDDYAISPDSTELAFTWNVDPNPATSTNSDIYTVPLSGGDSWIGRLNSGFANFQTSKNPIDLLATDQYGNNVITVFVSQIQQNALPAALEGVGAAIVYKIGKFFGL